MNLCLVLLFCTAHLANSQSTLLYHILVYAAAELGWNPVSEHQIQPEYGDEQADAGRDCRTRLARPNSQARTRPGKYSFSLFS